MQFWRFAQPPAEAGPLLSGDFNPYLVAVSIGLSCLAGIIALHIADRIEDARKPAARRAWLVAGAIVMGAGIWSMHFTGMLAFRLPIAHMTYDPWITVASVLPAMLGSGAALYFLTAPGLSLWSVRLQIGSLLMATGIGTMHYTGMEAMQMAAWLQYDFGYFVLSLVVAHLLAMVAISTRLTVLRMRRLPQLVAPLAGGVIMGHAVAGMHYTAMYAASFYALPDTGHFADGLSHGVLATTVNEFAAVLLVLAIFATWYDSFRKLTKRHATTDLLTGLPNRNALDDYLKKELAVSGQAPASLSLLVVGLDNFAEINNSLSHAAGDDVLRQTADRLLYCAEEQDFVGRFAGDEFAVVLTRNILQADDVTHFVERLLDTIQQPVEVRGLSLQLQASVGITTYSESRRGTDVASLMREAHTAMRTAKEEQKNYCFFSGELEEQAQERFWISTELRKALDADELELYYQPQVNLLSGRLVGFEALIRWHHSEEGWISPLRFVSVAERMGLGLKLDDFVIERVCRQCRQWLDAGVDFARVAINLSPAYLEQSEAVGKLTELLKTYALPTRYFQLEITEAKLIDFGMVMEKRLQQLRDLGFTLAIDDFGTGYSSLSYLKNLPVDKLKLDQSFVKSLTDDFQSRAIPDAVVGMAKGLNLSLIAEGIETEQQRSILMKLGYREGQGYLFSKPLPAEAVPEYIAALSRQAENSRPSVSN